MVATLETIDGLVVKKLKRGSLHIEVQIYKPFAAKTLWTHFQNGKLIKHRYYSLLFFIDSTLGKEQENSYAIGKQIVKPISLLLYKFLITSRFAIWLLTQSNNIFLRLFVCLVVLFTARGTY